MNLLRIEQTYAKIGVENYKGQLDIKSQLSRLQLQRSDAKIEIEKQAPRVLIDQHPCFASAGLKNNTELNEEAAQRAKQQAMEYIGRRAADGDALANIKNKGNPIAEIARRDSYQVHEFDIDLIPKERPRIEVEGYIKFSAQMGEVKGNVEEGFADINFSNPKLSFYLREKPSLNIQYVGRNIDTYA